MINLTPSRYSFQPNQNPYQDIVNLVLEGNIVVLHSDGVYRVFHMLSDPHPENMRKGTHVIYVNCVSDKKFFNHSSWENWKKYTWGIIQELPQGDPLHKDFCHPVSLENAIHMKLAVL